MTRRCSHCGQDGHNSRTCPDRGPDRGPDREVRLFGVRLTGNDGFTSANMRKSASMGNLTHYPNAGNTPSTPEHSECGAAEEGYVSDGLVQTSSNARERKKGVPWTEEEHRLFLVGLQKLGKGDWRGIARNFVQTRTPTQVASHAQKYFIRQSNLNKRKRRSSLFDIVSETGPRPMAEDVSVAKIPDASSPPHQLSLGPSLGPGAYLSHGRVFEPGMALMTRGSEVFAPMLPVAGVAPGDYQNLPHLQGAIPLQVLPLGSGGVSASKEVGGEATGSYGGEVAILSRQVPMSEAENTSVSGRAALPPLGPIGQPLGQSVGHLGYPYSVWSLGPRFAPPPSLPSKVVKPMACPAKIDEGCEMAKLSLGPSQPAEGSNLTRIILEQHPTRTSAFQLKPAFSNKSLSPSTISVV